MIHYDTICSPFSFYVFYHEIYVRVFSNLVSKNIINLAVDAVNTHLFNQVDLSNYKNKLLSKASYHSRTLAKFVNLSICVVTIKYIDQNLTGNDYSSFLRTEKNQ